MPEVQLPHQGLQLRLAWRLRERGHRVLFEAPRPGEPRQHLVTHALPHPLHALDGVVHEMHLLPGVHRGTRPDQIGERSEPRGRVMKGEVTLVEEDEAGPSPLTRALRQDFPGTHRGKAVVR